MIKITIECKTKDSGYIPEGIEGIDVPTEWRKGVIMVDDISHFHASSEDNGTFMYLKNSAGELPFSIKESIEVIYDKIKALKL